MQPIELAHLQPVDIEIAVADCPMRLHEHERGSTAPPTQVPAMVAGFELPGGKLDFRACRAACINFVVESGVSVKEAQILARMQRHN